MDERNDFLIIDETELDDIAVVSLYKEFIRILEKDIDDLSPSKSGFTPWTLLAAMGAVAIVLFGLGKAILGAETEIIVSFFLFVHFLLQWLYFLVNTASAGEPVKENRVYYPRERFGANSPLIAFRILLFLVAVIVAASVWSFSVLTLFGYAGFALLGGFYGIVVFLLVKNFLSGNNPAYRKGRVIWFIFSTVAYIDLIIVTFFKLPAFTETTYISYSIGGLLAVLVLLLDLYLYVITPSPLGVRLSELRDDVVFRRLRLNEALLTYRRIREGALFTEEVAVEFSALDAKLDERFRNFETMRSIAHRIDKLLPVENATVTEIRTALEGVDPLMETFNLAKGNVERLNLEIIPVSEALGNKAARAEAASGDSNSRQLLNAFVAGKDKYYQDGFRILVEHANLLDSKRRELVNRLTTAPDEAHSLNVQQVSEKHE